MKRYRLLLLYNTVKYLRPIQIFYRLYYRLRKALRTFSGFSYPLKKPSDTCQLEMIPSIPSSGLYHNGKFKFLNHEKEFDKVDWNFGDFGKLWTYNLNYFEFLDNISVNEGLTLINDYVDRIDSVECGLEAFPISLRGINWIKFIIKHGIDDNRINDCLYAQYYILADNVEFHICGNHVLENAFSLFYGAYFFKDAILYKKAKKLLISQLEEQILDDGGHYELSPMYHALMLFRLFDCINIAEHNSVFKSDSLLKSMRHKAQIMLKWMSTMSFEGCIPLFNDCAAGIAPDLKQLNDYGMRLGIFCDLHEASGKILTLNHSGYYKYNGDSFSVIIDAGAIGPDYIPGHSHCDMFSFELYLNGFPVIVDTGTCTYEAGDLRQRLRETRAHNTVSVGGFEQSDVWGAFRVGRRAKILETVCNNNILEVSHDGFVKKTGTIHKRIFEFYKDKLVIKDELDSSVAGEAYLHFHPDVELSVDGDIITAGGLKVISSSNDIELSESYYHPEFNILQKNVTLTIRFSHSLSLRLET